jgi:arginyl-tRNA synthetase
MNTIVSLLKDALQTVFGIERAEQSIHLEHPADDKHGDWSSNLAMTLAKELQQSPREIAAKLVEQMQNSDFAAAGVEKIEIAGPGFINFYMSAASWKEQLKVVGANFGKHTHGVGKRVLIEFGQPNTHKAFHVGHLKSAISGLSIVRLYENAGYEVVKLNFYGDVGMHVAKCTWGAMHAQYYREKLAALPVHERMKVIDSYYVLGAAAYKDDENAASEIKAINKQIYDRVPGDVWNAYVELRDWSLEHQADVFAKVGFAYDRQYPESEISEQAVEIVNKHTPGLFEESEGAIIFNGEGKGVSTWVFLTSEGNPTYEAKDLALAYKKNEEYNPELSIITTSVEQSAHFKTVIYCLEQIDPQFVGRYKHLPFGWLLRGGKKQSSRMGDTIKGVDILQESEAAAADLISTEKGYSDEQRKQIVEKVGLAGLKFLILSHEFHKDINYDPANFITLEGFSGPYVMYAYARARTLLRDGNQSEQALLEALGDTDAYWQTELEQRLTKLLLRYPEISLIAATEHAPHLIAHFAYQLANLFNQFYTEMPILKTQEAHLRNSRLLLTARVAQVLRSALGLLGIDVLEQM